ncbi:hypothetical protein, partial [Kineococcus glutinatus]|uniref:hypothetical protein n=1 Tax=Kineococcus glutinatus TaxID=1070872 RepID=UPI0031EC0838
MTGLIILASLLLAAPSLLDALQGRGSIDTALLHLALALVVSTVAARVVRSVFTGYEAQLQYAEDDISVQVNQ